MATSADEQIHASAVHFLLNGGERDAANVLLSCSLKLVWLGNVWFDEGNESHGSDNAYKVVFGTDSSLFTILRDMRNPITKAICSALEAAILTHHNNENQADDPIIYTTSVGAKVISIGDGWREELLEIARGKTAFNQGIAIHSKAPPEVWNNLYFRSKTEVRIAEALDRAGVLFLPNCRARLSTIEGKRDNREPDFLICYEGHWGILEVDGEPWHPPSRTVDDHDRDRLFKRYGIRTVEHYDSKICYANPDQVVRSFLELLKRSSLN